MQIIKWDKIRYEIETSKDIQTLTLLKDKLKAYKVLAEQSKQSAEVQSKITIYKARADRKCGEWLKANVKHDSNQYAGNKAVPALKEIGVTKNESSRLQKIADIPDDTFEEILEEAEKGVNKVTDNMFLRIAKEAEKDKNNINKADLPEGIYNVIYADPPWQFANSGLSESAANQYPTMATEDICNMNIKSLSCPNTVLFIWATNAMLEDAFQVLKSWGFNYKTNIVWAKNKGPSIGWFLQTRHELLLIATASNNLHPNFKPVSWFEANVTKHSKKPELVYDLLEKMYEGPYLELFARNRRGGWSSYGNQVSKN